MHRRVVKEHHVVVSDDPNKDTRLVFHSTVLLLKHIHDTLGARFSHLCLWSDGCAGEFKNRGAFFDHGKLAIALGGEPLVVTHDFHCSGHGKGEWDGLGGRCKTKAAEAVVRQQGVDIRTARQLYEFLAAEFTQPGPRQSAASRYPLERRYFHWLGKDEVDHGLKSDVKDPVPQTLQQHQLVLVPVEGGVVEAHYRNYSCWCGACRDAVAARSPSAASRKPSHRLACPAWSTVGPFEEVDLLLKDGGSVQADPLLPVALPAHRIQPWEMLDPESSEMRHCIIQHSDEDLAEEYAYYVLSATSTAFRLPRARTDGYKQRFPGGALVVEGHYYSLVEGRHQDDRQYTLDTATKALVWASSVKLVGVKMAPATSDPRWFIMDAACHEAALEAVGANGP
jgi:hypothetical protein